MSNTVTLTVRTAPLSGELKAVTRSPERDDVPALGQLYLTAYDNDSRQVAEEAMTDTFDGKYGKLLLEPSQVAVDESGKIIAGVLVVERPAQEDAPQVPFLVDLFTDPEHRREGLAVQLVKAASEKLFNAGYEEVAVKVHEDNSAALALYLSIDFRRWETDSESEE